MDNPNLKIPLALIQEYKLSTLAILIYGELNGLYSKYHKCDITDKELSKRLNRSIPRIQHGLNELKKNSLIFSKQKPNYRGRSIQVAKVNSEAFILIPVSIVRYKNLSQNALLVYGSLYSELKKQIKINEDKKIDDDNPSFIISKAQIAQEINRTIRTVGRAIQELSSKKYIIFNSINGVGIEISFLSVDNSNKNGRPRKKVGQKREATYDKNEKPPMTKARSQLGQKRATNRILININKDDYSSSSNKDQRGAVDPFDPFEVGEPLKEPVYYDSIPNENDMPPQMPYIEITKEVAELNTLDHQISIQNATQHKTSPITGKSGSESGNKYIDRSTKPTRKKYHAYNGFNLNYQVDQLRRMLNSKTNKRYIITSQQIPLIEQRLKDGFTLYDFERAIDYLVQQKQSISVKELVINISNYLNKINSN